MDLHALKKILDSISKEELWAKMEAIRQERLALSETENTNGEQPMSMSEYLKFLNTKITNENEKEEEEK